MALVGGKRYNRRYNMSIAWWFFLHSAASADSFASFLKVQLISINPTECSQTGWRCKKKEINAASQNEKSNKHEPQIPFRAAYASTEICPLTVDRPCLNSTTNSAELTAWYFSRLPDYKHPSIIKTIIPSLVVQVVTRYLEIPHMIPAITSPLPQRERRSTKKRLITWWV